MFGRRQGEILFRPVIGVELVLAGDPPKWNPDCQARFVVGVDYGHGTDWVRDAFLNADCDTGAAFKRMYMSEWAAEPEAPIDDSPRYANIKRSDTGASFVWGGHRGGKTARLDDFYRNHYTVIRQSRMQPKYYPPGFEPVAADFNNSVEREVARVQEDEAAR